MQLITTNSNIAIEVQPASFKEAINLKKAVFECLKSEGAIKDININDIQNIEVSTILDKIFAILMNIEMSDNFENALFECLKHFVIEDDSGVKHKITKEQFDEHIELRSDYYQIIAKCIEENLRPFFKSLASELFARLKTLNKSDQE